MSDFRTRTVRIKICRGVNKHYNRRKQPEIKKFFSHPYFTMFGKMQINQRGPGFNSRVSRICYYRYGTIYVNRRRKEHG